MNIKPAKEICVARYDFAINGAWLAREEQPAQIGEKFMAMLDAFGQIEPAFSNWRLGDYAELTMVPMKYVANDITGLVENNVHGAHLRRPEPKFGYGMEACSRAGPISKWLNIRMVVGSSRDDMNNIHLGTGSQEPLDLEIVTYPAFRAMLTTLVSIWTPAWLNAYAYNMEPTPAEAAQRRGRTRPWIIYLSAPLAVDLEAPADVICEETPDGGRLLAIADQRPFLTSAQHMARSDALFDMLKDRVQSPYN